MAGAGAPSKGPLAGLWAWLEPALVRWRGLSPRDRSLAAFGAAILMGYAAWSLGIAPALKTLRQAPVQLAALDGELQAMQRLAAEAATLKAQPPLPPSQAAAALKAASDRLGDAARISVQGERAVLTFKGLGADALQQWLGEVREGARARPVEAQFTRDVNGFAGSVTVTLGGGS
jgi:general secretion pathway protein M